MPLSNDICRCHDDDCPSREICERYKQRGTGHEALEAQGWTVETWAKKGGYQGADDQERIWFSPHCLRPELETQMSLGF